MSVDEIFQTMRDLVSEQFAMEPAEVTMDTSFEEDLGADSVDLVELVMAMEEEFDMGEARRGRVGRTQDRGRRGEFCRFQAEVKKSGPAMRGASL